MIDKVVASPAEAIADVRPGSSIVTSGFGLNHGYPASLIVALRNQGTDRLCIIANSLGAGPFKPHALVENHQVERLIVSFTTRAGSPPSTADEQLRSGAITVELVPQGTLVERMRAGGSGIGAIYTRSGVGTEVALGKEVREFDGVPHVLERALTADFAFIRAWRADRSGNLQFRGVGRNFNPSFAKASKTVIAEVDEIVEGELDPELVELPGVFVHRVVLRTEYPAIEPPKEPVPSESQERPLYHGKPGWSREELAAIAAALLPEPSYVNLGLGMPTLISNHIDGREIMLHAENGLLGYGAFATEETFDPDLYNAGSQFVTLRPGASFFDSVAAFEMVRGGHLDVVVLGAFQVDAEGSFANWRTPEMAGGAIGGAMDLVAGDTTVMVLMTHCDRNGKPKLVERCTLPLTGVGCVDIVVTDLCVLRRCATGFRLERVAPGFTMAEVQELTEMELVQS